MGAASWRDSGGDGNDGKEARMGGWREEYEGRADAPSEREDELEREDRVVDG